MANFNEILFTKARLGYDNAGIRYIEREAILDSDIHGNFERKWKEIYMKSIEMIKHVI